MERKRREQTKKCWELLMLASEEHPNMLKVLAKEKILSHGDILDLSQHGREAILQAIAEEALHDEVGSCCMHAVIVR